MRIKKYLIEMRVHHYIKNLLVLVPLVCSGEIFNYHKFLSAFTAFFAFCFMSSAVYFINDLADAEKDKKHPIKCQRPIPSGEISRRSGICFTLVLLSLSMIFNFLYFDPSATLMLVFYLILNLGYNLGLKTVPLLDISILVSGFLIRTLYGSIITEIKISNWLYLVILSASFYLVLGKRRNECKLHNEGNTRDVIKKYSYSFLDSYMKIFVTLFFVFYSLWTMDANTIAEYHNSNLIWTVPVVMMIFMRYSLLIEGDSDGDPVEVLIHDKALMGMSFLYLLIMFLMLYVLR